MSTKSNITITDKKIYTPTNNTYYEIGSMLTDFLELDLTEYNKKIEAIKNGVNADGLSLPNGADLSIWTIPTLFSQESSLTDEEKHTLSALANALIETQHPYAYAIDYLSLNTIKQGELFELFDLVRLQSQYRNAVEYCLLKEDENDVFNPLERYLNYPDKLTGKAEIKYTISDDLTMQENYLASDISSLLYIEFMKMLQFNICVVKCENCGRLFAVKGNYNKKYCDRIIEAIGKSCQEVGATNSFKRKMQDNPIIGEYQKAYKRIYARKRTGKISQSELTKQIKKATALRDKAIAHKITEKEFLDQIRTI